MSPGEWIPLGDATSMGGWWIGKTLTIVLWSGLGLLTVALLVLIRTRWGQARPLSKCVALSVFAHVLLMGYAYGTRLFDDPPVEPPVDAIHVQIVHSEQQPQRESESESREETPPWEKLAADELVSPESVDLLRQATPALTNRLLDVPEETPRQVPRGMDLPPTDSVPLDDPDRPSLTDQSDAATRIRRPGTAAELPDAPQPEQDAAPQRPPLPDRGPRPRREMVARETVDRETVDRETVDSIGAAAPLPAGLLDFGGRLQQLASLAEPSKPAESVAREQDRLRESNNLVDGQGAGGDLPTDGRPPDGALPEMVAIEVAASQFNSQDLLKGPSPRRLGDGAPLPPLYRLRTPRDRLAAAKSFGGDENTEAAVNAALTWLAANQSADGRWDCDQLQGGTETRVAGHDRRGAGADADTGITGLVVLAFLAAGETHLEGKYRETVQRGLEFLLRSQKTDGNLAGSARLFAVMYCHGMASLALSEAYAMTGDHRLKPFVRRAAQYTIQAQHPTTGGWRYQPGDRGDMSQFGWQIMALKSAELAGLEIPQSTLDGSLRFLRSTASGRHGGLAAYREGERPSPTMTAEALVCRSFLNLPRNPATEDEAARLVLSQLPEQGQLNLYLCYYGTLGLFQIQGNAWQQWQASLRTTLLRSQRNDGLEAGSWNPDTVWGSYGGRAYSTAMATLCLEVYYRYLPLYLRLREQTP